MKSLLNAFTKKEGKRCKQNTLMFQTGVFLCTFNMIGLVTL